MLKVSNENILITSKFIMTAKEIKKDSSFTISQEYNSDDLSIMEINDIAKIYDVGDRNEIISKFKFEDVVSGGFGKIKLNLEKKEEVEFDNFGNEAHKIVKFNFTITALDNISANSILSF